MEKRVLVAVSLSFLVLFLYQTYIVPPVDETAARPAATRPAASGAATGGPAAPTPAAAAPVEATVEKAPFVEPRLADSNERDVVVQTPRVKAVFTNRGAQLKSYVLTDYRNPSGKLVDLVPAGLPAGTARPFSLRLDDAALSARLNTALFKPSADSLTVQGQGGTLRFDYQDASGVVASKEFRFEPAGKPYVVEVTAVVTQNGTALNPNIDWGPALGDSSEGASAKYAQASEAIFSHAGDTTRVTAVKMPDATVQEGTFDFAGVDDHYFVAAVLPGDKKTRVEYERLPIPGVAADPPQFYVAFTTKFSGGPVAEPFFIGPKNFDVLKTAHPELVRAIHFGMFSFLVVPLLTWLKWINSFVGNYGWSIIIMTVLINAAMFPLRHKSVVSMRKMQEIQPEVKAIQDRYAKLKATDPAKQKMNTEVMNLYREKGVNPASGCMPMLLTMPVLFAFYSLLSVAIEIRGAPFVGWIHDLSAHDPLYVTPILMGLTMVVQQKMTPSTADPVQQKVMMLMPVMFTFMFLWAPSGLVLYWLMSNLWAIGQQQVTNKIIGAPAVRPAGAPEQRRLKKIGGGRTERAADSDLKN